MPDRQAKITRQTRETSIALELNIDGSGQSEISTGIFMFDHLLQQVARHGTFDIKLIASGDDPHHLIEDIGIAVVSDGGDLASRVRVPDLRAVHAEFSRKP